MICEKNNALKLWQFIRSDTPLDEFTQWLYHTPPFEELLNPDLYFSLISFNFKEHKKYELAELKNQLRAWLEKEYDFGCCCMSLSDVDTFRISDETVIEENVIAHELFEEYPYSVIKERNPYIRLALCANCHTYWHYAVDFEEYDITVQRLHSEQAWFIINQNQWPVIFDDNPAFGIAPYPEQLQKSQKRKYAWVVLLLISLIVLLARLFFH